MRKMSGMTTVRKKSNRTAEDIEDINGLPFYPQYCFKLSPTVNTYPHLRASDIEALTTHSGFGGESQPKIFVFVIIYYH